MAQVPYTPYAQVAPEGRPTPSMRYDTPLSAFGGSVAAATSHLGDTMSKAGDEIFQRAVALQQLAADAEAREADTKYMMKAGELHANYNSLEGKAAVDAYPGYMKDLEEARKEIRTSLTNPYTQKLYDASSKSTMGRTIFNGAGHAASQNKRYVSTTIESQINLDQKTVEDNPKDDILFRQKVNRVKQGARELSTLKGNPDGSPQEELEVLNRTSAMWRDRIIGLSRTAPFEAKEMLDKNSTNLTEGDRLKVDQIVTTSGRAVGAANLAQGVYMGGRGDEVRPAKTLREMEDEVRGLAKKQNPDDPLLEKSAVANLQTMYNQDKYAKTREDAENWQTVLDKVVGDPSIRNERDLRLDPKTATAVDNLPKQRRVEIPGLINRYTAARDKQTNEETSLRLYGMAQNAPGQFAEMDLTKEKLSQPDMLKYMKLQQKMRNEPNMDPRLNRALSWMRGARGSELQALDIFRRTDSNKDTYDHYVGALQQAINVWQEEHGKAPGNKEIIDEIGPQVIRQRSVPGSVFGSLWPSKKPFYEQEVPEKWGNDWKKFLMDKGETEPTQQQIYRDYIRYQLMEMQKSKGTGQPKPNQPSAPAR